MSPDKSSQAKGLGQINGSDISQQPQQQVPGQQKKVAKIISIDDDEDDVCADKNIDRAQIPITESQNK